MILKRDEKVEVVKQAAAQGVQGGIYGAAASIVSGVGIGTVTTTTPVTICWGWIVIGSSTVTSPVWLPAVIGGCAIGGAVVAGTAGAAVAYRRIKAANAEWSAICNDEKSG